MTALGRGELLRALVIGASFSACTLFGGPSRVRSGELFQPGEPRYDAYFKEVHDLQVASAGWTDDRKASCRPLVDSLKLSPDAADVSIIQGAHERVTAAAATVGSVKLEIKNADPHLTAARAGKVDEPTRELFKNLELCAQTELARVKELRAVPARIDELARTGRTLEGRIREDFARRGGRAGMDVQRELTASYEVLDKISRASREGGRSSDDFVATLQRAVDVGRGDATDDGPRVADARPAKPAASVRPEVKPAATKLAAPKPAPAAEPKPAAEPAPKPKPKPAEGEVFNP